MRCDCSSASTSRRSARAARRAQAQAAKDGHRAAPRRLMRASAGCTALQCLQLHEGACAAGACSCRRLGCAVFNRVSSASAARRCKTRRAAPTERKKGPAFLATGGLSRMDTFPKNPLLAPVEPRPGSRPCVITCKAAFRTVKHGSRRRRSGHCCVSAAPVLPAVLRPSPAFGRAITAACAPRAPGAAAWHPTTPRLRLKG